MKKIILLALLAASVGCAKKAVTVHPGAVSNLDSYAYDILLVEHQVLLEARAQYTAGTLPAAGKPILKTAIEQYNIAQAAWHAYHDQHAGNTTALQDAINALIASVSQLQQTLGRSPAPMPAAVLKLEPEPTVANCWDPYIDGNMHEIPCGGVL